MDEGRDTHTCHDARLFCLLSSSCCFPSCYNSPSWGCLGMDVVKTHEYPDVMNMTPVGFEPTQLALVELESTPLDHSGKVSLAPRGFVSSRSCRRG